MQEDTLKKPVSMGVIAGVAIAAILVLAFIGYKVFASSDGPKVTPEQAEAMNKGNSSSQGASYSQQIQSAPKVGGGGSHGYGSSYGAAYGRGR